MNDPLKTGGLETGTLRNPLEDLREFAKISMDRHETMQAATRREAANNKDTEIKRTHVEMAPLKGFAPPPQTRGKDAPPVQQTTTASVTGGAFFTKYVDDDGHTWLQGGLVKSGSGNFSIADKKVIDSSTGGTEADGDILVIKATVNGYVVDGVLLAGLTATSASYITPSVATTPNDTMPTISAHTGRDVHIEIGRWANDDFLPSGVGNILIAFCPGSYQITRF